MNEPESTPAVHRKKGILWWPTVVMAVLIFGTWVLLYHDIVSALLNLLILSLSLACLICFLVLMILRRPKRSLSFLIPILLFATWLSGWSSDSRDYVEFLIYDAQHHIKEEVRQQGYKYKEWQLNKKYSDTDYEIVYDVTDGIVKKNGVEEGGCTSWVTRVGEHFYFTRETCPGIL